jgi:hypothetical protein
VANQILRSNQPDKQSNTGALIIKVHNELAMPLCKDSVFLKKNNTVLNTGIAFQRKKVSLYMLLLIFLLYEVDYSRDTYD